MGYYLASLETPTKLGAYLGSATVQSAAAMGAFDSVVNDDSAELLQDDHVVAVVDGTGVRDCLSVLRSGGVHGRDVEKFITEIETNHPNGFLIRQ